MTISLQPKYDRNRRHNLQRIFAIGTHMHCSLPLPVHRSLIEILKRAHMEIAHENPKHFSLMKGGEELFVYYYSDLTEDPPSLSWTQSRSNFNLNLELERILFSSGGGVHLDPPDAEMYISSNDTVDFAQFGKFIC